MMVMEMGLSGGLGAAAGVLADAAAARLTGGRITGITGLLTACAGGCAGAYVMRHAHTGWHSTLLPLWLWGWLVAADADARSQELYDAHTVGLLALALLAGSADRQGLVSVAGAGVVGAIWLMIRAGLGWWTWRSSVLLALVGAVAAIVGMARLEIVRHEIASGRIGGTPAIHEGTMALLALVGGIAALVVSPALAWLGHVSRRVPLAEDRVGGADVILWSAVGAWYGVRWVWPVLGVAAVALGAAAIVHTLISRTTAWRSPWGEAGIPVVPVLWGVLVAAT